MKRPLAVVPHMPGLFELERLADDAVSLAEQIKKTVAELRGQEQRGTQDDDPAE